MKDDALNTRTIVSLKLCLLVSTTACTGGTGGRGGSGVDKTKTVSEITADEATAVCQYGKSPLSEEDYRRGICTYLGIEEGSPLGCQIAFEECIAGSFEVFKDCSEEAASVGSLPECASLITVAELEDCLYAETALEASDLARVSCDTPAEEIPEFRRPVECEKLDEVCPTLFG